jgi:non-specific serine/threonine protein kinase
MMCAGQTGDLSVVSAMVARTAAAVEAGGLVAERGHQALQRAFHAERIEHDLPRAREELRAALVAFETDSPGPDLVLALGSLGSIERQLGNMETARRLISEALEHAVRIDDAYLIIAGFFHRGWLELDQGETVAAQASFVAGLEPAEGSDRVSLAHQLEGVACALAGADPSRAARLFGAAERVREVAQAGLQQPWQTRLERGIAEARHALGEPAWERERAAGRELTAGAILDTARGGHPEGRETGGLTRRETEVAGLVATGMTNRALAGRLFLSERTVESHLDHLLTKLRFTSRAQLAAWVASRQS